MEYCVERCIVPQTSCNRLGIHGLVVLQCRVEKDGCIEGCLRDGSRVKAGYTHSQGTIIMNGEDTEH